MERFEKKVWLATPTMHGEELLYVKQAYETNWMSTVGENINEVERIAAIVRRLADEYADAYLPLDEKFAEALPTAPNPMHYSDDGVHPNENGAAFIGEHYAKAILPLLKNALQ